MSNEMLQYHIASFFITVLYDIYCKCHRMQYHLFFNFCSKLQLKFTQILLVITQHNTTSVVACTSMLNLR